ncbi:uncharacterized protein UBRO2_05090 [Ustilago bromivora]|uniref:PLP-dependent transferase n=1 Tax=Ustilago bromivora TaxID=307758 RepID=A0A8H8QRB6_9BASI|nr:uncharacterized protein UBRO2_05090 [Ustilago bromivora]
MEHQRIQIRKQHPSSSYWRKRVVLDKEVEEALRRSVNPWTGRFWEKLYSRPDPVGIAGDIVVACSNASGHVESANPYFARVETFCVRELAKVFGMDPDLSDGVTMPGGSASNTLALQTCLISRFPSFRIEGVAGLYSDLQRHDSIASCAPSERSTGHERRSVKKVLVFASEHCHYSIEQSAVACGLGSSSVIKVAGDEGGKMSVDCLAQAVQSSLEGGDAPLFVCATAGMTVLGTFDDIRAISSVCEEYGLWLHIDASWGGPAIFCPRMRALGLTSQLKVEALYLFHSVSKANLAAGFDHATKTLGCGRRPDAFKFYLAWKRHGSKGFGERITQALVQAEDLRGYILLHRDSLALELGPVPSPPFLQVCFRPLAPVKSPAALANGLLVAYTYDIGAKLWLSTATGAFQAKKIDIQTRWGFLEAVFRACYYHELIRELISNVRLLPNAFVHDVLDTSQNPAVVRHITVHNGFFPTTGRHATSAEPIHSNKDKADEYPEPELPVLDWRKYYSKVLPILQSSGFGKTRMCVQLSTISPGMLICLRHKTQADDKQHQESFPPQDSLVFEYFQRCKNRIFNAEFPTTPEDHERFNQAHLGVLAWLAIYCKTIAFYLEQLKRNAHDCFGTPRRCDSNPRLCWQTIVYQLAAAIYSPSSGFLSHKLFEQPQTCPRIRLVQDLSDPLSSTDTITTTSTPTEQPTKQSKAKLYAPMQTPPQLFGTRRLRSVMLEYICKSATELDQDMCIQLAGCLKEPELLVTAIKEYLKPHLDRLEQSAPEKTAKPFFFIALDECGSMPDLLPIIRRVWFHALPTSTWILLIDTNSVLAPLAGDTARKGSRRTHDGSTHRLTQPFSLMPLDVNFTEQQRQKLFADVPTFTLRKLNQLLPTLGRPLWYDGLYRSEQGVIYPLTIIDKLVYPAGWKWDLHTSWMHHDEINQNLLALVSQRIYLEVSSRSDPKSWYEFIQNQIGQHLRFIGRIYTASDSIITNTPSEPPLSAAVAWFFRCEPKETLRKWGKVIQALVHANEPVGFNLGAKGEHGVAVLCTMAIDVAASQIYSDVLKQSLLPSPSTSSIYAAVFGLVPVRRWLKSLIGGTMDETSALWRWADRAWLNFKHIVRLEDQVNAQKVLDAEELVQLWFRQAAAQGISNQPGWDFLIPVYESNTNEAPGDAEMFDKAKLSYIAIQVKNCIKRPSKAVRDGEVGPRLAMAEGKQKECLELFFDLKGCHDQQQGHMYSQRRHPQPKTDTPLMQADQRACQLLRHHLYIAGQDGATFPQLDRLFSPAKEQVALLFGGADPWCTCQYATDNKRAQGS